MHSYGVLQVKQVLTKPPMYNSDLWWTDSLGYRAALYVIELYDSVLIIEVTILKALIQKF